MIHAETATLDISLIIEDQVLIGSGVHIYVENHKFDDPNVPIFEQGHSGAALVVLEKGCWIGANVIILPGVTIGKNAVIGAGSVVTKSIPEKVIAVGNPAKVIRSLA
ncbi:DapH/DapD/GlmU-related protein [Sphingobacterium pedocola]|nr:DapH/DapD/GlmU-related protein [Sphingobacterium pedocola]